MCIYIYVYIYVFTYIYIYTYIFVCTHTPTHTYSHLYIYKYTYARTLTYAHTHTHTIFIRLQERHLTTHRGLEKKPRSAAGHVWPFVYLCVQSFAFFLDLFTPTICVFLKGSPLPTPSSLALSLHSVYWGGRQDVAPNFQRTHLYKRQDLCKMCMLRVRGQSRWAQWNRMCVQVCTQGATAGQGWIRCAPSRTPGCLGASRELGTQCTLREASVLCIRLNLDS